MNDFRDEKKQMPGEKSKGEVLTAMQGIERGVKSRLERLQIDERFARLQARDAKFGFLLDIDKLSYGDDKNALKTHYFVKFYRSGVDVEDLYFRFQTAAFTAG